MTADAETIMHTDGTSEMAGTYLVMWHTVIDKLTLEDCRC